MENFWGEKNKQLMALVKTLVSLIEEKDAFLKGHSKRVADTCVAFVKSIGLSDSETEKLYLAGLLHDIGMIHMPLEVIHKEGELTDEENRLIRQHPLIAEKILSNNEMLREILPIIRHHHEAFDGSGYPDGMKGEDIPYGARILRLVDSYDAMLSPRPYRPGMSLRKVLSRIEKNQKGVFDETLARQFCVFVRSISEYSRKSAGDEEETRLQDAVLDVVRAVRDGEIELPHLPRIVHEIQKVAYNPSSTVEDLAKVVERDAVISLKLISLANSSYYRRLNEIYSVRRAIPLLGFRETQGIIIAIAYKDLYDVKGVEYKVLMENLWLHCLASAYAAKVIGEKTGEVDVDRLFLMGLIHDIGKVALLRVLSERFEGREPVNMANLLVMINKVSPLVSVETLKHWRFGGDFIRVARSQGLSTFDEKTERSVLVTSLAGSLSSYIGYGDGIDESNVVLETLESAGRLGLDVETLEEISGTVEETVRHSAHFF